MKRLLILLCVVGLLAALPLSHVAMAAKPEEKPAKVAICHVNSANDVIDFGFFVIAFGKVIDVSENAVAAHEAHGDSTTFLPLDEDLRDFLEWLADIFGISFSLPNADCVF